MTSMTMRERQLAVIRGEPHDQVPFVMYDTQVPIPEARALLGEDGIGLMRWVKATRFVQRTLKSDVESYEIDGTRWERTTLHTPLGDLVEERAFEPVYDSSSAREHFVKDVDDYPKLWAWLEDGDVVEDQSEVEMAWKELGDHGIPLVSVDRTPYQQLWVQWVGLGALGYHMADKPDWVAHTIELLQARQTKIYEIIRGMAQRGTPPGGALPFVDVPDNITSPALGPRRFKEYCVPEYDRLADMLDGTDCKVFVHMDGDLKPLWDAIAASKVDGLDSFSPAPDNDTTVADAVAHFPGKRLWINFPSSVHLRPAEGVREVTRQMLEDGGHTGRMQIQISENVPPGVWRTSFCAIADEIIAFGAPG